MNKCIDAGLENFLIEVVTDKAVGLEHHRRVREIVVPPSYRTKTGALFKARALQYCLEDGVNVLADTDWIVHLDEETLLTENSVRGILNFVMDGKYHFGQGLITYANEEVVNWITTLADTFRVADDMGKLRFQFKMFHKPLFSWKGSYVVTQVSGDNNANLKTRPCDLIFGTLHQTHRLGACTAFLRNTTAVHASFVIFLLVLWVNMILGHADQCCVRRCHLHSYAILCYANLRRFFVVFH